MQNCIGSNFGIKLIVKTVGHLDEYIFLFSFSFFLMNSAYGYFQPRDLVRPLVVLFCKEVFHLVDRLSCPLLSRCPSALSILEIFLGYKVPLHFNTKKCNIMRITRKQVPFSNSVRMNDTVLEDVKEFKGLRVLTDCSLSWNSHTDIITA